MFKLITPRDNKNIILICTSKLDHKKQTNNRASLLLSYVWHIYNSSSSSQCLFPFFVHAFPFVHPLIFISHLYIVVGFPFNSLFLTGLAISLSYTLTLYNNTISTIVYHAVQNRTDRSIWLSIYLTTIHPVPIMLCLLIS